MTVGISSMVDDESGDPNMMYSNQRMDRNLRIGDAGEAFFRYWFETNCHGLDDLVLHQFGYNPDGRITDEEKSEMLKALEESPDFALFSQSEIENPDMEAEPKLGISINTQKKYYDMEQARSPKISHDTDLIEVGEWGCFSCPRGDDCWGGDTENLWFNEYNISNDYALFKDAFDVEVVMISIISTAPYSVDKKYTDDLYIDATREYLMNGRDALSNEEVVDFLDDLNFDQRYKKRTERRDYKIVFLIHSEIKDLIERDQYHITGGPTRGRPRPVACISKSEAYPESDLVEYFDDLSTHNSQQLHETWYVKQHENQADLSTY